ncbi:MAG: ankyrin repeat domain-containing protein [Thermoplasmatota archaeon]
MGWFGKAREKGPGVSLREKWLSGGDVPPVFANEPVRMVLVDIGLDNGCVTVMSAVDGATSVYNSAGGGTIGYGEHPEPAAASKELVAAARDQALRAPVVKTHPLPPAGIWAIHIVAPDGVHRVEARENALNASSHPLHGIYVKTHAVITACRMTEWKKSLLSIYVRTDGGVLVSNGPNPEPTLAAPAQLLDAIRGAKSNNAPARLCVQTGADATPVKELLNSNGLTAQPAPPPTLAWPDGCQSVHIAAAQGRVEVIKDLAKRGAKVDAPDSFQRTALHVAADLGRTPAIEALLDAGANVNARDRQGNTPIMMAAQKGRTDTVRLLLERGADTSVRPSHGFTALGIAQQNGHSKVVDLLQKAGPAP